MNKTVIQRNISQMTSPQTSYVKPLNDSNYELFQTDDNGVLRALELPNKVDKVDGKELSENDFTTPLKNQLESHYNLNLVAGTKEFLCYENGQAPYGHIGFSHSGISDISGADRKAFPEHNPRKVIQNRKGFYFNLGNMTGIPVTVSFYAMTSVAGLHYESFNTRRDGNVQMTNRIKVESDYKGTIIADGAYHRYSIYYPNGFNFHPDITVFEFLGSQLSADNYLLLSSIKVEYGNTTTRWCESLLDYYRKGQPIKVVGGNTSRAGLELTSGDLKSSVRNGSIEYKENSGLFFTQNNRRDILLSVNSQNRTHQQLTQQVERLLTPVWRNIKLRIVRGSNGVLTASISDGTTNITTTQITGDGDELLLASVNRETGVLTRHAEYPIKNDMSEMSIQLPVLHRDNDKYWLYCGRFKKPTNTTKRDTILNIFAEQGIEVQGDDACCIFAIGSKTTTGLGDIHQFPNLANGESAEAEIVFKNGDIIAFKVKRIN